MEWHLELHVCGVLAVSESKVCAQVVYHVWDLLGGGYDGGVDLLLVLLSFGASGVLLLFGLEDLSLVLSFVGVQFDAAKVLVINSLWHLDGSREPGAGGEYVLLVNSSHRDTVDLEGSGDQKEAALELLEKNNPLTSVSASNKNKDGAWDDALLDFLGGSVALAGTSGLKSSSLLVGRVVPSGPAGGCSLGYGLFLAASGPSLALVHLFFGVV